VCGCGLQERGELGPFRSGQGAFEDRGALRVGEFLGPGAELCVAPAGAPWLRPGVELGVGVAAVEHDGRERVQAQGGDGGDVGAASPLTQDMQRVRGPPGRVGWSVLGPPAGEQREPGRADRVGDALGQRDQAGGAVQGRERSPALLGEGLGVELGAAPGRTDLQGRSQTGRRAAGLKNPKAAATTSESTSPSTPQRPAR